MCITNAIGAHASLSLGDTLCYGEYDGLFHERLHLRDLPVSVSHEKQRHQKYAQLPSLCISLLISQLGTSWCQVVFAWTYSHTRVYWVLKGPMGRRCTFILLHTYTPSFWVYQLPTGFLTRVNLYQWLSAKTACYRTKQLKDPWLPIRNQITKIKKSLSHDESSHMNKRWNCWYVDPRVRAVFCCKRTRILRDSNFEWYVRVPCILDL